MSIYLSFELSMNLFIHPSIYPSIHFLIHLPLDPSNNSSICLGISAAFMVWDAIDLGFTISDLVRKQGSAAAKTLR